MNKYTFRLLLLNFNHPLGLKANDITSRRLHEGLQEIRICVLAVDINDGVTKAKSELTNIISLNFGDIPFVEFYVIRLKLIEVSLS